MKINRCHCDCVCDNQKKCLWSCQIREFTEPNRRTHFLVHTHAVCHKHCHPISSAAPNPGKVKGLEPDILAIVTSFVKNAEGKEAIVDIKPKKILSRLVFHAKKKQPALAHRLRRSECRDEVHDKLRGFFFRKQEAHLKERLGVTSMNNNLDCLKFLDLCALKLPPNCQPCDDCKSGSEIAVDLGLKEDDDDKMFVVDLTRGRVHDVHRRLIFKPSRAAQQGFSQRAELGFASHCVPNRTAAASHSDQSKTRNQNCLQRWKWRIL